MQLADFGAEVIKVERPGVGDDARSMGPTRDGLGYPFQLPNRNKQSLAVDLKSRDGREIVARLVESADVVVENFRPGVATRLGFGYSEITARNREVIYCSISGFGQTGPISQRPGFDIIAQGMAGFLRMNGPADAEPSKFGVAVTDLVAGLNAALAIVAAYVHKLRTGSGQYIDVSLLDAGLALTVWEAGAWFADGTEPLPTGSRHRGNAPYQAFATSDGYVTVGANNDNLWGRLCDEVLECPALRNREEYRTGQSRIANVDQLEVELAALFQQRTTEDWTGRLDRAGVPGGPVLRYSESLQQPQVLARGMIVDLPHPVLGSVSVLGPAAKMSISPPAVHSAAPLLGEHSAVVLRTLGCTEDEIVRLTEKGVIEVA